MNASLPLLLGVEDLIQDSPLLWAGFIAFILLTVVIDLGLFSRRSHVVSPREALTWSIVWVSLALLFNAGIWHWYGAKPAEQFLAGYLLEKSLSVDNLFVFVLVFGFFRTPPKEQHRVLVWGILGALILRAVMIIAGAALIKQFHWMMGVFGAFLIYTGIKMLAHDEDADPGDSRMVRFLQRTLPLTKDYRGRAFFVREDGRLMATPLFLVLVVIEASDVVFAVDSIPAIFGVTTEPFIVFTSNIFAILGLRALFFLIQGAIQRLRYLNYGLSLILAFIGVKMLLPFLEGHVAQPGWLGPLMDDEDPWHVKTSVSLGTICATLAITTVISLLAGPPEEEPPATPPAGDGKEVAPAEVGAPASPPVDGAPATDERQGGDA